MKQKGIIFALITFLLLAAGAGGAYYFLNQNKTTAPLPVASPTPLPSPTVKPQPTEVEEKSSIPSGWLTYRNQEYGFEISYPENYQALDDEENLCGWPNGIVLIYGGGQSYDLPIEVWDTVSEYENKYKTQLDDLTVKKVGNKYITLLNMNREEEVNQIIDTFSTID